MRAMHEETGNKGSTVGNSTANEEPNGNLKDKRYSMYSDPRSHREHAHVLHGSKNPRRQNISMQGTLREQAEVTENIYLASYVESSQPHETETPTLPQTKKNQSEQLDPSTKRTMGHYSHASGLKVVALNRSKASSPQIGPGGNHENGEVKRKGPAVSLSQSKATQLQKTYNLCEASPQINKAGKG